jgi:hypothetical protein
MPVPWLQIVTLMPSILEVSRELLKRTSSVQGEAQGREAGAGGSAGLEARVASLEENERRQAELVKQMADQLAQLTEALTVLHTQTRRLLIGQVVTAVVAVVSLVFAIR